VIFGHLEVQVELHTRVDRQAAVGVVPGALTGAHAQRAAERMLPAA
jgi:hypothetical protein